MKTVLIHHFSDVLCVWAYVAQVRVDELCRVHGKDVDLRYHFVDVFGDVPGRTQDRWSAKGGLVGYAAHVAKVVSDFDHVDLHPDAWSKVAPNSSLACHQFLHAVAIASGKEMLAKAAWAMRVAFFSNAIDISQRERQLEIAEELNLGRSAIERALDDGAAIAGVSADLRMAAEQKISVSPTLVFNEGRQMLKGNVSYRAIEANISELLSEPAIGHSWC